mgnify:CR=1 FL=1
MNGFSEDIVEHAGIEILKTLGWSFLPGPQIAPDGAFPARQAFGDVVLLSRLEAAVEKLNPTLPDSVRSEAVRKLLTSETGSLVEENRRIHRLLTEGVPVEYRSDKGAIVGDRVWLLDLDDVEANTWLVVNQFTVVEAGQNRRPDVVLFVNGLPLAVLELKNAAAENATLDGAFNQLQTYLAQIPSLFRTNVALVTSDGVEARIGSLTAAQERFMPWRTVISPCSAIPAPVLSRSLPAITNSMAPAKRYATLSGPASPRGTARSA